MFATGAGFSAFFLFFGIIWLLAIGSLVFGIAAIVSVAQTPNEAFGPWWDNTKQAWLIGLVVSFVIPFGHLIAGYLWFSGGRAPLRAGQGFAGRPFWAGPPRPQPPMPPPGWPGYPPPAYGYPPPPPAPSPPAV